MMNNQSTAELIARYEAAPDDSDEEQDLYDELVRRAYDCPVDATEVVHALGWDLKAMFED